MTSIDFRQREKQIEDAINLLVSWDRFSRRHNESCIFDCHNTIACVEKWMREYPDQIDLYVNEQIGLLKKIDGHHPKGINKSFEHRLYIRIIRSFPALLEYGCRIYAMLKKLAINQNIQYFIERFEHLIYIKNLKKFQGIVSII